MYDSISKALVTVLHSRSLSRILFILFLGLGLATCATEKIFHLLPNEQKARLMTSYEFDVLMCINGEYYKLQTSDTTNNFEIPAGMPIILSARPFLYSGSQSVFLPLQSCRADIGLVAKNSATYLADLKVNREEGGCELSLRQIDSNGRTIEKIDPDLVQHNCFYYSEKNNSNKKDY